MSAADTNCPAVTGDAVELQRPVGRQRGDLHRRQGVGRAVVGIAEAEIRRGERVRRVLVAWSPSLSAPAGASFTDGDVDRDGVGRLVEIDAAVGGAAVVLHLEGEVGVAGAVRVGRRARTSACRR